MNRFTFRFWFVLIFVTALLFSSVRLTGLNNMASAQAVIQLVPVATGLSSPLYATSARDGSNRLFIVEQPGRIKALPPGGTAPLQTPFLDVTTKVVFGGER